MHFYNEFDPRAAAWLRELIAAGLIPDGVVDERSITELKADELTDYTQCHFFAGIGGWPLALQLAGWDPARPVWTGSCPCQPFSVCGSHMGSRDERHLFPAFRRLIARARPPVVFGEQVASKAGRTWFARVRRELETLGYAVGADDLCAAGIGAPHIRQRLFWVGHALGEGLEGHAGDGSGKDQPGRNHAQEARPTAPSGSTGRMGDSGSEGPPEQRRSREQPAGPAAPSRPWDAFDLLPCTDGKARRVEPGTFPLAHGIPARVGRLRGYGNAIVPQVGAEFIRVYLETLG